MTATWESVEVFSIESVTGGNKLYANGRQSIMLRIGIKVIDIQGNPVALTERERLSLTLVDYHGVKNNALVYRKPEDATPVDQSKGDWDWSIMNIGNYQFFPFQSGRSSFSSDSGSSPQGDRTEYIHFYARTVSSLPLTMSVRITRDDGTVFESRDANGGSFEVRPEKPRNYAASDYQFQKIIHQPYTQNDNWAKVHGLVGVTYYQFGLVVGGERVEFKSIDVSPGGLHSRTFGWFDDSGASLVGFTHPGKDSINYLHHHTLLPAKVQATVLPGQVYFVQSVLHGRPSWEFNKPTRKPEVKRCKVSAVDVYGNTHPLVLKTEGILYNDPELV